MVVHKDERGKIGPSSRLEKEARTEKTAFAFLAGKFIGADLVPDIERESGIHVGTRSVIRVVEPAVDLLNNVESLLGSGVIDLQLNTSHSEIGVSPFAEIVAPPLQNDSPDIGNIKFFEQ